MGRYEDRLVLIQAQPPKGYANSMIRSTFVHSAFGRVSAEWWPVRFILVAAVGVGFDLIAQNITIATSETSEGGALRVLLDSTEIIKQQRITDHRWDELWRWMVEAQGMAEPEPETKALILAYLKTNFSSER